MAVVTMRELLDSGVHFGHQTRRWNPKMKRFIFTERNGIYIIDIQQSLALIDKAYEFVKDVVAKGGNVMFVGTKKQAQEPILQQAARVGMPSVTERWLGGMLTNFPTVYKRIQRLKELEALETANDQLLTKKELLVLRREREKLNKNLDGIRNMTKLPAALFGSVVAELPTLKALWLPTEYLPTFVIVAKIIYFATRFTETTATVSSLFVCY